MELTIDEINNLVKNNETLINKNNRLEEELNQTKLLLEGKNTEFNELFKYIIEDLKPHAHLYKTTLEEIKKITEEPYKCIVSEVYCCELCDRIKLIKAKISEVIK